LTPISTPPTSTDATVAAALRRAIRDIPDFPGPGVVFKDVTPLVGDARLFRDAVSCMTAPFVGAGVTHVVAIESRGFLFGAPAALVLNAGLVPVRKRGKLPHQTQRVEYALEYGTDCLEIHGDAFAAGARVLIVDDVLATGGTAAAARDLTAALGGDLVGFSFLLELSFLDGRGRLRGAPVAAVITY
jgi:adenine phosphoribosyltransferase